MVIIQDDLVIPEEVFNLKRILEPTWPKMIRDLHRSGVPLNEGEEGGSGEGEGGTGTATGEEGSSGAGASGEGSGGSGEEGSSGSGSSNGKSGSGKKDDEEDPGQSSIPTSELQRLRRIAREKDEADKKRKEDQEKELQKKKKEEGRWQELLQEEQEKARKAEADKDTAVSELTNYKRRILVERVAKRLGWREPADAHLYLDSDDMDDEGLTEAALKKVAKQKDFLVNPKKATGGPGPSNGQGGLTVDDIKQMSQEEINRRWDDVQKVLEASGQR